MRRGFTLIELLATLAIAALLVGVAAVSFTASRGAAGMNEVTAAVGYQDQLLRAYATAHDAPLELKIDFGRGRIGWTDPTQRRSQGHPYALPAGFRITEVRLGASPAARSAKRARSGEITVACSALGYTPGYALELNDMRGQTRWLLVLGLTGERIEGLDEKQIDAILGPAASRGHDAH